MFVFNKIILYICYMKLILSNREKSTIWSFIEVYDGDSIYDKLTNSLSNVLKGTYTILDIENIYSFWNKIKDFTKLDRILFTQMEIANF